MLYVKQILSKGLELVLRKKQFRIVFDGYKCSKKRKTPENINTMTQTKLNRNCTQFSGYDEKLFLKGR